MVIDQYGATHEILERLKAILHSEPLPHLSLLTVHMHLHGTSLVVDNRDDYSTGLQHFHATEAG
jgi:hypothetical protein